MAYSELFNWWIASITFNIVFVTVASVYLYRRRKRELGPSGNGIIHRMKDFVFVWILIGLLVLYVVSIGQGSYLLFVAGNIAVEILLVAYVIRSGGSSRS